MRRLEIKGNRNGFLEKKESKEKEREKKTETV